MKLRYITCSDPREYNPIPQIIELGTMPNAEIAVQCHPTKMLTGMSRNVWFKDLLSVAYSVPTLNLAIHINNEWAYEICAKGKIPAVLAEWILTNNQNLEPIIKRIQLNMSQKTAENINPTALAQMIAALPRQEIIFQYNDNTKNAVEKMHQTGAKFSLLFDASGGRGIPAKQWQKPVYATHPMGYSGGISPDNVVHNLRQINSLVPTNTPIWIDAERRLKSNDLFDDKEKFDIELARTYITRAKDWESER